jgi:hypothetical protein
MSKVRFDADAFEGAIAVDGVLLRNVRRRARDVRRLARDVRRLARDVRRPARDVRRPARDVRRLAHNPRSLRATRVGLRAICLETANFEVLPRYFAALEPLHSRCTPDERFPGG